MTPTDAEKEAAAQAKAQADAQKRVADLETQLAAAEEKAAKAAAQADAKVADLEAKIAATAMGAGLPMPGHGTITVDAAGTVQG